MLPSIKNEIIMPGEKIVIEKAWALGEIGNPYDLRVNAGKHDVSDTLATSTGRTHNIRMD